MMMSHLKCDYKILYWSANYTCIVQIVSVIHDNSSISDYEDAIESLPLLDCINMILVAEIEYQVDSCIEPTIDHK